jgi:hypothetical protein
MMIAILLATLIAQNGSGAPCAGALPAISSVAVDRATQNGELNDYMLRVRVLNRGDVSQAGNVLQSVDIYRNGTKVDQKGVPPLKAGGTYTFLYSFQRNSDAGDGSTKFTFRLDPRTSNGCDSSGDRYNVSV